MSKCVTKKRMYATEEVAEEALIAAWVNYSYAPGAGPIAVYRCEDCGAFHLTSKGTMNQRLSTLLTNGKIDRDKEANRWLNKIKGR